MKSKIAERIISETSDEVKQKAKAIGTKKYPVYTGVPVTRDGITQTWTFSTKDFRYHTSWDWLMPVVEKIKQNYDVSIRFYNGDCVCYINKQSIEELEICSYGNFEPSILNVYKSVVEFIKWYNKKQLESCK